MLSASSLPQLTNLPSVLELLLFCTLFYYIVRTIYNLYFHPLSKFPGPKIATFGEGYICWLTYKGQFTWDVDALHRKYGPVVRIAPNQLSFSGPTYQGGDVKPNLVTETDITRHGNLRKLYAHAFSTKALQKQEEIVQGHIHGFLRQLHTLGNTNDDLDMSKWFELVTFDVISDLTFGESFGSVQSGIHHPIVSVILENVIYGTQLGVAARVAPILKPLIAVFSRDMREKRSRFLDYTRKAILKRMRIETTRKDLMDNVLKAEELKQFDEDDLLSKAQILLIAGSETTATFAAGVTYWLFKSPGACAKVQKEVRERYSSVKDITSSTVGSLPYLNAVVEEGLCIFPPVPLHLDRISPGATVDGEFIPRGTRVAVNCVSATRNAIHFHDPDSFIPERWLDPELSDVKSVSQPFIMGPRVCIGRNFALMEMRLLLAKIHFLFDLEYVGRKNLDWDRDVMMWTLWKKPELMVKFKLREGVSL
ncbi:uncharacterized protein LAJ45_07093 [Neofusicoccum parvum]|nr:uncharacterized protein LAJ45_07093 [Neofusicoccum parvum]